MEQNLPNLPLEIIFDVLSRLPVKPLCRFKSVSKPWLALITDPQFIKSHLHRQSIKHEMNQKLIIADSGPFYSASFYTMDYEGTDLSLLTNHFNSTCAAEPLYTTMEVMKMNTVAKLELPCESLVKSLGSINGVLLFDTGDQLCIWNPSIRMYQKFSPPKYIGGDHSSIYGLGYDSVSDDFKVVSIINQADADESFTISDPPYAVHVFSSKLSSWKSIGDIGYTDIDLVGTVINGAPHWVAEDINFPLTTLIVSFDATEEKFKEVPMPNCEGENDFISLGFLGGWLCVTNGHQPSHADVWVMKEYGVKESWTKLFVVPSAQVDFYYEYFTLLGYTKDGEVLMRLDSSELLIYDPKQNKYKRIGNPEDSPWFVVDSYVESLVSPYGYNGTRRHN